MAATNTVLSSIATPETAASVTALVPHKSTCEIVISGATPTLVFSEDAYRATVNMADMARLIEVGWLARLEKLDNGDFYCTDFFIPKQKVSAATTEISLGSGYSELIEKLINQDGLETGAAIDRSGEYLFWGHSHHGMGVEPSGQDDSMMELFKTSPKGYAIRAIVNKRGLINLTLYDYVRGITYKNLPFRVESTRDELALRQQIYDRIRDVVEPIYSGTGSSYNGSATSGGTSYPGAARHGGGRLGMPRTTHTSLSVTTDRLLEACGFFARQGPPETATA